MRAKTYRYPWQLQGGEDTLDALNCRSFFSKEPLILGLFCGKWPRKIRHPMGLCHPDSFVRVAWPINTCGMTHLCVRHDALLCAPLCIRTCGTTHVYINTFVNMHTHITTSTHSHTHIYIYIIDLCGATPSHAYPWLIVRGVTHSCVRKDPCMCNVTHSHVWCDSFMCVAGLSTVTHPTRGTRHAH